MCMYVTDYLSSVEVKTNPFQESENKQDNIIKCVQNFQQKTNGFH